MSTRVAVGSENTARTFRLCSLGLHRTPIIFWPNPEEVPFHLPEWIKKNTWFESLQGFISEAQLVGHRNEAFLQLVVATGQRVVIRGQGRFLKWDTFVPRTKVRTRRFVRRGQHTPCNGSLRDASVKLWVPPRVSRELRLLPVPLSLGSNRNRRKLFSPLYLGEPTAECPWHQRR